MNKSHTAIYLWTKLLIYGVITTSTLSHRTMGLTLKKGILVSQQNNYDRLDAGLAEFEMCLPMQHHDYELRRQSILRLPYSLLRGLLYSSNSFFILSSKMASKSGRACLSWSLAQEETITTTRSYQVILSKSIKIILFINLFI